MNAIVCAVIFHHDDIENQITNALVIQQSIVLFFVQDESLEKVLSHQIFRQRTVNELNFVSAMKRQSKFESIFRHSFFFGGLFKFRLVEGFWWTQEIHCILISEYRFDGHFCQVEFNFLGQSVDGVRH